MATRTNAKKLTEDQIITWYMDHVLEHGSKPGSIYKFCKTNGITEAEFYKFFGSMEGLQKSIWEKFYTKTQDLMQKNAEYEQFTNKDKMLTFFYTFFELMALNRSYVLFCLKNDKGPLKNLPQLKGLRKHIKQFAKDLIEEGNAEKSLKITMHNPQLFSEGAWLQFLFILRFWINDDSAGFEKTDLAIEKSVNTIFDLWDNTPLENIVDFGKFLFKETFA